MPKEESKPKFNLLSFFKSSFSRRGKKKKTWSDREEGTTQAFSSYEDFSTTVGEAEPSPKSATTDATSTTRGSRSSFGATTGQQAPNLPMTGPELNSIDGRCQSPAPSQARSNRHSVSKVMFGEHFNTSFEHIKQQLGDSIRCLREFKDSLRPSTDDQRYNEAVGSLERVAKNLTALKSRFSIRKCAGNPNRNSYTLPPPDLKVSFEDVPFSITIPGIEGSQQESALEVVQESKEV